MWKRAALTHSFYLADIGIVWTCLPTLGCLRLSFLWVPIYLFPAGAKSIYTSGWTWRVWFCFPLPPPSFSYLKNAKEQQFFQEGLWWWFRLHLFFLMGVVWGLFWGFFGTLYGNIHLLKQFCRWILSLIALVHIKVQITNTHIAPNTDTCVSLSNWDIKNIRSGFLLQ